MSGLLPLLLARIAQTGPLTIADYMVECLTHPRHGYYTSRDPLGAAGDFTTAPEISQMFGELVGLAIAQAWLDRGAPAPFALAEAGPGRGTLMADILRATRAVPGFHAAMSLHLVEVSPALRARQAEALAGWSPKWHAHLGTLPELPLFLVANEFLDALPIRQFVRQGDDWAERVIGRNGESLTFGMAPAAPLADLAHRLGDTHDGDIVEVSAPVAAVTGEIARRIAAQGGVALFIDYGGWRSLGDTVQALRAHAPADPLETPGEADLTAHVDFEAVARAARAAGAATTAMTAQGVFLERLGITERARALARSLSGPALDQHVAAHRRLTHPDEMGALFKAIAVCQTDSKTPPGLDP